MTTRKNMLLLGVLVLLMLLVEFVPFSLFSGQEAASSNPVAGPEGSMTHMVRFGGEESFAYNPSSLTVRAGDTVVWQGNLSTHPLDSDTAVWSTQYAGSEFSYTFRTPGSYGFFCQIHGTAGGGGMSGVVVVQ